MLSYTKSIKHSNLLRGFKYLISLTAVMTTSEMNAYSSYFNVFCPVWLDLQKQDTSQS